MPNMQKHLEVHAVDPLTTKRRTTLPMTVGLPPQQPVEAVAPSTLNADLPTIRTLLAPGTSQGAADGMRRHVQARREAVRLEREGGESLLNHSPEWMAAIGRLGGQSKSAAKSRAARLNGAKGGRPRKTDPLVDVDAETRHEVVHIEAGNSLPASGAKR
ncbi:hypothetical protein [Sphaerotilus mobilis]|uniref:Uncharacterized protein n=1 Tax=Sphaerotilus mobilis TaxID=47994 RepID=A0A4Q7LVM3_9BURK|nr:hypothetical protein [Sphaerotilus mobilis]RZS58791.1 hypothetical protein EV685_1091 [Sphaerotilus mobilis]